jgi:hypothetical protein
MDLAYAWLQQERGEAIAEALCLSNPRSVLLGEILKEREAVEPTAKKWFQRWRS